MGDRLHRMVARSSVVFATVGLVAALGSLSYGVVRNRSITRQIQNERARVAQTNCDDVNNRHDRTIRELDRLIAEAPLRRKAEVRQGRASTVLLINSLVPKRDCKAFALSVVKVRP